MMYKLKSILHSKVRKSRGYGNIMIRLVVVLAVLLVGLFSIMYRGRLDARKLAYQYMEDTAKLYVDLMFNDISNINSKLVMMLLKENPQIFTLPDTMVPTQSLYYKVIKDLVEKNQNLRMLYKKYSFYEYSDASDFLILDNGVYYSVSQKTTTFAEELSIHIKEYMKLDLNEPIWKVIEIDNSHYLFSIYQKSGAAVGCVINVNDLFEDLHITNLEYEGIPFIIDEQNNILVTSSKEENYNWKEIVNTINREKGYLSKYTVFSFDLGDIERINMLVFPSHGLLERILGQEEIWISFFCIAVFIIFIFYYFYIVLRPMRQFVQKLQNPNEELWLNEHDNNGIVELEMASKQFRDMMKEIKYLKISVYEKELAQKKIEIEYMQEQIKPHFFLNCISIIHGMAEMIHADNIVKVSEKLSNYMRYVIRDSFTLHTVKEELEHIQSYIDIQQIRYTDAFTYELIVDENVNQYTIPPLILQVFVENAIGHGVILGSHIDVTLYLTKECIDEKDYLYITLSDTGKGFQEEVLKAIKEEKPIVYDGREHIGIKNAMKRLKAIYGDNGKLNIYNMREGYGAIVELTIPLLTVNDLTRRLQENED